MKVGWGMDVHRFGGRPPILLAGVVVDTSRGVEATSDGDVVAHAVADALLGAAALGDLGEFFPPDDPSWKGANSMVLLTKVVSEVLKSGLDPAHVDVTVVSQSVRIAPHKEEMRAVLADVLHLAKGGVSVKATTTDELGFIGRDEGIAAMAVAVLREPADA